MAFFAAARLFRRHRILVGTTSAVFAVWTVDRFVAHEAVTRNVRAVAAAARTLFDYKFMLTDEEGSLEQVHARVAKRWYELCRRNGGLYIKLGQQVATLNHVLPPEFVALFSQLHDRAPSYPWPTVKAIVEAQLGLSLEQVFASFTEEPAASASIAQVHRAVLVDGTAVAVKIQKPNIAFQMPLDLLCYRLLVFLFEKAFDLPMYWMVDNVCENLLHEADFLHEAHNIEAAKGDFAGTFPNVVVPVVHWPATRARVLTMEWMDGVKVTDADAIQALGFRVADVMETFIAAMAYQVFVCGRVHGDPHPGNIFVRPTPGAASRPQIVVLDHGMYISESPAFRHDYCRLWQAMVLMDTPVLKEICEKWGMNDFELFASMQLFRNYKAAAKKPAHLGAVPSHRDAAQLQARAKERVRELLKHTELIPEELIILGRHFNIMRANNKQMGSPVNRINICAAAAAQGAGLADVGARRDWRQRVGAAWAVFVFRGRLWLIASVYHTAQLWSRVRQLVGLSPRSFEQVLEESMARSVEHNLGFKINLEMDQATLG